MIYITSESQTGFAWGGEIIKPIDDAKVDSEDDRHCGPLMTTRHRIFLMFWVLKGWVRAYANIEVAVCSLLSARSSQTSLIPLQDASPKGRKPIATFCTSCGRKSHYYSDHLLIYYSNTTVTQPRNIEPTSASLSSTSNSSESYASRTSTPPTEISEAQSSPTFAPPQMRPAVGFPLFDLQNLVTTKTLIVGL